MRLVVSFRAIPLCAAALCGALAATLSAQALSPVAAIPAAELTAPASTSTYSTSADDLPAAPSSIASAGDQTGAPALTSSTGQVARKYSEVVLPGQSALPLTGGDKVKFAFVQAVSPFNIVAWGISSAYSQAVDSAPHYGQGWGPYGQRYGAAAARGTMQTLAADAVFAPLFHDDPRYYELGRSHKFVNRGIYAATRTVITRSDSGTRRLNLPLLVGYGVAAGASYSFYPDRDRTGSQVAYTYAGSIGGAALGFLFDEFLDDGLRAIHFRK